MFHDGSKTSGGLNEAIAMLNKWEVTFSPELLCSYSVVWDKLVELHLSHAS